MYTLETVEQAYRERLSGHDAISPGELIDLSVQLFHEIKLEGVLPGELYADMLLFEYGAYDWYDGQGKRFVFSVTRQWFVPENDEPYQLCVRLRYDPAAFRSFGADGDWSYDDVEAWRTQAYSSKAYKLAESLGPQEYDLWFGEC